jgi:membrane associated rhomboid family serine protease
MPITPWVGRIIFANIAVFVLTEYSSPFERLLGLVPALVLQRPWTLVTYAFVHAGFGHIFFNMLTLFFFGPRVEAQLGSRRFVLLYLLSAIGGGLLSYTTPFVLVVGASGAVFGVLVAFAYFWPRDHIYIWGALPVRAWILVVVYAVLDLVGAFGGTGGTIAHFAHLGGAAAGFITVKAFDYTSRSARRQRQQRRQSPGLFSRPPADPWTKIRRDELHEVNRAEFDRIMEKIHTDGVGSLTQNERAFLETFASRF